jgi:hypothetical protein
MFALACDGVNRQLPVGVGSIVSHQQEVDLSVPTRLACRELKAGFIYGESAVMSALSSGVWLVRPGGMSL